MSIQDFRNETIKRGSGRKQMSPAEEELHDFSLMIYNAIENGATKAWVREAAELLVKSIAPNLSQVDTREAVVSIEGIALTVLMQLFGEGTLIKKEVMHQNEEVN